MNIVIVGGGRIGRELMQRISQKGNNIILIEHDEKLCRNLSETTNSLVINADGTDIVAMKTIDIGHVDYFVTATGNDSINLTSCLISKKVLQVGKTVSIVNDHQNSSLFRELGVDTVVDIPELACGYFDNLMKGFDTISVKNVMGLDVSIAQFTLKESSPMVNKSIKDVNVPQEWNISLIVRGEGKVIPRGDTVFHAGDIVFILSVNEKEELIRKFFMGKK